MSYTIRKKRPRTSPPGDSRRCCAYCGIPWYRSQLRMDASGNLACPDEGRGRDVVTLNMGNIEAYANRRQPGDGWGPADGTVPEKPSGADPGVDWNGPSATPLNLSPIGVLSVQTKMWLRGDQVTLGSGGGVSSWNDQSNSNNALAAGTLAAQPTYAVSDATLLGLPTVTFDGANHFLTKSLPMGGPWWAWGIAKQVTWTNSGFPLYLCGFGLVQNTASPNLALQRNLASTNNAAATIGSWFRSIASFSVSGTDTLTIHGTTVSDASGGQRNGVTFSLCANATGAGKTNISWAELLVTTPAPTAAEIAALDAYGLARYGSSVF